MTPQEVKDHFGTRYNFWKQTGLAKYNLNYWFKKGYVPMNSQAFLHRFTNGKLKIDLDLITEEGNINVGR